MGVEQMDWQMGGRESQWAGGMVEERDDGRMGRANGLVGVNRTC